jgi:hypothetical protein
MKNYIEVKFLSLKEEALNEMNEVLKSNYTLDNFKFYRYKTYKNINKFKKLGQENLVENLMFWEDVYAKRDFSLKLKHFDNVYRALINITNNADEDCPSEFRSNHFRSALEDAYYIIGTIDEEVLNSDRADEPPSIEF